MKKLLSIVFISVLMSSCGSQESHMSGGEIDYEGRVETKQAKEDSDKESNYLPIILIIGAVAGLFAYKKYVKKE